MKILTNSIILTVIVFTALTSSQTVEDSTALGCSQLSSQKETYGCSQCTAVGNYQKQNLSNTFYGFCVNKDCIPGCVTCNGSVCTNCATSYFLNNSKCEQCPNFCLSCSGSQFCSKCTNGYHTTNGQCTPCAQGCGTCSDATTCQKCNSGYFEDPRKLGTCSKCPDGCSGCTSSNVCTDCEILYELKNNRCESLGLAENLIWTGFLCCLTCIIYPLIICCCLFFALNDNRKNQASNQFYQLSNQNPPNYAYPQQGGYNYPNLNENQGMGAYPNYGQNIGTNTIGDINQNIGQTQALPIRSNSEYI